MYEKLKKMLAVATIVFVSMFGVVTVQAPAQAAVADCTNFPGTLCLWKDAGAGGSIWRQTRAQVSTSCTPLTNWAGWNDTVTSARNNTSSAYIMELYWDNTCTGTPVDILYGFTYDFTGNSWNNQFSGISWRFA